MRNTTFVLALLASISVIALASSAQAMEKTDGFVCPVLSETVGEHNPNVGPIGDGHYSFAPGGGHTISVPIDATNMDGAGSPPGPHAAPGDEGYSPIWNTGE